MCLPQQQCLQYNTICEFCRCEAVYCLLVAIRVCLRKKLENRWRRLFWIWKNFIMNLTVTFTRNIYCIYTKWLVHAKTRSSIILHCSLAQTVIQSLLQTQIKWLVVSDDRLHGYVVYSWQMCWNIPIFVSMYLIALLYKSGLIMGCYL